MASSTLGRVRVKRRAIPRDPRILLLLPVLLGGPVGATAQDASGTDSIPPADRYTIHLVTMGVGDAIWERFGHNGLLVQDHSSGDEILWEWGIFDFDQVDFIPRLARGEMLYSMGGRYLETVLATYAGQNRTVWAQELALTPDQERDLVDAIYLNYQPENRDYLYDYYEDNCSTRLRDALDAVLDGALAEQIRGVETGHTWRWHTRRLLQAAPWGYMGIQFVLGHPGDERIDRWQEMFLPLQLRDFASTAVVPTSDGGSRSLVAAERILVEGTRPPAKQTADSWLGRALVVGVGLGMLLLGLGTVASRSAVARIVLGVVGAALAGAVGFGGTVLVLAWAFTDHDFWAWNETLLQATPFLLILATLMTPMWIGRRPPASAVRLARWLSAVALAGLLMKVIPIFDQANLEVIAVLLPIHLGLAGGLARAALEPTTAPVPVDAHTRGDAGS